MNSVQMVCPRRPSHESVHCLLAHGAARSLIPRVVSSLGYPKHCESMNVRPLCEHVLHTIVSMSRAFMVMHIILLRTPMARWGWLPARVPTFKRDKEKAVHMNGVRMVCPRHPTAPVSLRNQRDLHACSLW